MYASYECDHLGKLVPNFKVNERHLIVIKNVHFFAKINLTLATSCQKT